MILWSRGSWQKIRLPVENDSVIPLQLTEDSTSCWERFHDHVAVERRFDFLVRTPSRVFPGLSESCAADALSGRLRPNQGAHRGDQDVVRPRLTRLWNSLISSWKTKVSRWWFWTGIYLGRSLPWAWLIETLASCRWTKPVTQMTSGFLGVNRAPGRSF